MAAVPPPPGQQPEASKPPKAPQELVSEFWDKFFTKKPGKVTSIFPRALYATLLPAQPDNSGAHSSRNAAESYEAAAAECREQVRRVVRECERANEKFTDPDFDIDLEADWERNCLNGLVPAADTDDDDDDTVAAAGQTREITRGGVPTPRPKANVPGGGVARPKAEAAPRARGGVECSSGYHPGSVHRVDWIFESPRFTVDGYSASDIQQGSDGDCWWLAAVANIAHRKDLMDKVCVARDEEAGVYGFVFQRDGEWISTTVDDNLYLIESDFDYYGDMYDATGKRQREFRERYQTGSEALYFARCADKNETWLPLLEKAYAKAHGDYDAISGGWSGDAVEDLTGGVTSTIATNRVLRKDKLWRELVDSSGEFVFALSAISTGWDSQRRGLALNHAYSVLKATEEVDEEGNKVRLVQIRNPWGERAWNGLGEWNGPWSDGSKEWTPYWLKKLDYTFGDDGIFWMSYKDMLDTFYFLHRTRLFDDRWTIVQQWTSANIGWISGYLNTKFVVEIKKGGMVVIMLTQLDDRYFKGLEGQYTFTLHFLLQREGSKPTEHICRVRPVNKWEQRSVSCEVELEPGRYEVLPKITAKRDPNKKVVQDVIKDAVERNPQKLRQVGLVYDLAHAKGGVPDEDGKLVKKEEEKKKKEEERKKKEQQRKEKEKAKKKKNVKVEVKVTVEDGETEKEKKEKEGETKTNGQNGDKKDEKASGTEAAVTVTSEDKDEEKFEDAEEKPKAEEKAKEDGEKKDEKKDEEKDKKPEPVQPGSTAKEGDKDKQDKDKENGNGEGKADDDDDDNNDDGEAQDEPAPPLDPEVGNPWNAVCVMGLRVYAKDPDVSITLVEPKDAEEASSLTVDSVPAGATM